MAENQRTYIFSDFRLDTANKSLSRAGAPVPLTPKVFDTLVLLVENAPNLVEKDVLMTTLWPEQFVEESNITFNIKMLRKAFEDNAADPTFIETIPRRGYRFIAQMDQGQPDAVETLRPVAATFRRSHLFGLLALVLLLGFAGIAFWKLRPPSNTPEAPIFSTDFRSAKLTNTGKVNHAVISPDGKYIAYTNEVNGKQALWLRQISDGSNTEIQPSTDLPFYGLAFSHDSESIFFTRREHVKDFQLNIYKMPIFGGVPTKIVDNSQGEVGVLSNDRQIIFVRYSKGVNDQNKLMMVDIDGRNEKVVATSDAPNVFWATAVSPDRQKVLSSYGHTNNAGQNVSLVEIDLSTGEKNEVAEDRFFQISSLAWLEDQRGFLFTAARTMGEPARIWTLDYQTRKIKSLTNDATEYTKVSLTNNADKLVATTLTADFGFFIGSDPSTSKYLTQARDGFSISTDGKIIYASDAAGSEDIWIMDENGANQKQLTTDQSLDAYPLVSSDGYIYFVSNRSGDNQIWRMKLDGSDQKRITKGIGGQPLYATTDGKWIYYSSATDQIVWKVATDGSSEKQLFPERTGFYQAFSPDGSQMAYLRRNKETNKFEISVVLLGDHKVLRQISIPDGKSHPYFLNWTTDGKGLTYSLKDLNGDHLLRLQALAGKESKVLFNLGNEEIMDCRISSNGKNYLFIRGSWKHDAVLLKGFNLAVANNVNNIPRTYPDNSTTN